MLIYFDSPKKKVQNLTDATIYSMVIWGFEFSSGGRGGGLQSYIAQVAK